MRQALIVLAIFAFVGAFAFVGCEKQMESDGPTSSVTEGVSLFKAGNGNLIPRVFNMDGKLCPGGTQPMELWMGVGNSAAGTLVGTVEFISAPTIQDPNFGFVKIHLNIFGMFPFYPTDIHIHFASTVAGIPHAKNGNPIPGQFEYNTHITGPPAAEYTIPVSFDKYGAIHLSSVENAGVAGYGAYLPTGLVHFSVTYPYEGGPSYFPTLTIPDGGPLSVYNNGVYQGWCVDINHVIYENENYCAYVYSSYALPQYIQTLIPNDDNFGAVNYLLNKYVAGQVIPTGTLTYGDIQKAIWNLLWGQNEEYDGLGQWTQVNVDYIYNDALAHKTFEPGCGQMFVFVVAPVDCKTFEPLGIQLVVGQFPVPCAPVYGTAWGDGKVGAQFPGASQWGTYFKYDADCTP